MAGEMVVHQTHQTIVNGHDLTWVKQVCTVDAIDKEPVRAFHANPAWQLIGVGVGEAGQTTLTYGWPWEES